MKHVEDCMPKIPRHTIMDDSVEILGLIAVMAIVLIIAILGLSALAWVML